MISLKTLIDFLPPIFKDTDTYKVEGKGILERFLEVCGEYLEDDITKDIESTLDLIDIDKTSHIYLNYLWELLGEIPFGSNIVIDKEQWSRYYDGTLSDEELLELSKNWVISRDGIISLQDSRLRALLKYSLTLLKIRGTKKFFETLFNIYGIKCTIEDFNGDNDGLYAKLSRLDSESSVSDITTLDNIGFCNECLKVKVDISTNYYYSDINGVLFVGSDYRYFTTGGMQTSVSTIDGISLYNDHYSDYINNSGTLTQSQIESLRGFVLFRIAIEQLFDKYLPCNVKPIITYNGITPDDKVNLNITYLTENKHIIHDYRNNTEGSIDKVVKLKVEVSSLWSKHQNKFQISHSLDNWDTNILNSGHIIEIKEPGDYYFRSLDDSNVVDYITITEVYHSKPSYELRVFGMVPTGAGNCIQDGPVFWLFNNRTEDEVNLSFSLYKDGLLLPPPLEVRDLLSGNKYTIENPLETISLPVGKYHMVWEEDHDVFTDIEVNEVISNTTSMADNIKNELRGLPYGVTGSFIQREYYLDENRVQKELNKNLGTYGRYLPIGSDYQLLRNSNVVTMSCSREDVYNLQAIATQLKPWAYKYDELLNSIVSVELHKVDVWYTNETTHPYLDTKYRTNSKETVSRGEVEDTLNNPVTFTKLTTITVNEGDTNLNLTNLLQDTPYFIKGGIFLLHPNTQELIDNGIYPNMSTDEFYPNFLAVVVPCSDVVDETGSSKELGLEYSIISYKYQGILESRYISENYSPQYSVLSGYTKNNVFSDRDDNYVINYHYLEPSSSYNKNDNRLINFGVTLIGHQFSNYPVVDSWFDISDIIVLNNTGYNSIYNEFIAGKLPKVDDTYGPQYEYQNYIPDSFKWGGITQRALIFLDRFAPFVNVQHMLSLYNFNNIGDGLYIKPVDIPDVDISNIPEGFPWEKYVSQPIWSEHKLIKVPENDISDSSFRKVEVNTCYNTVDTRGIINTIVNPIRFQFIVYKDGREWSKDYYLVDRFGNKYYPGSTYEIRDLGSFTFLVVPNVTENYVPPIEGGIDPQIGFHQVTIINGKLDKTIARTDLWLNKSYCLLNTKYPDRYLKIDLKYIQPLLGVNNRELVKIYKVSKQYPPVELLLDCTDQPMDIYETGSYNFQAFSSDRVTPLGDIVTLDIVDPFQ